MKNNFNKKQNNKGFTLVELIAVIVLIAIVGTLAVLSVSSISDRVKLRQKENILSTMKVQAKKYIEDTGMRKVYVDTLIKEGYVSSDKVELNDAEDGNQYILDPTDKNSTLNCYYYDFSEDSDGKISSEANMVDGECNLEIYEDSTLTIKYCDKESCNDSEYKLVSNNWITTSNIKLKAFTGNENILSSDIVSSGSKWTTSLAPDVDETALEYQINSNGYVETTYRVAVRKEGRDYTASSLIRIDSIRPRVSNVRVNEEGWANVKYIYFDINDEESKLNSYIIVKEEDVNNINELNWENVSGNVLSVDTNTELNRIKENGTYYIFVKDNAGNISEGVIVEIDKVDTTAPECTNSGDSTVWTKEDRIIYYGCSDEESGCDNNNKGGSTTFSSTTKTTSIAAYTIQDNAGNSKLCPARTANVYVDKTAPSITTFTITSKNANYNSKDVNYSISGTDTESGLSQVCYTNENSSANCDWETIDGTYNGSSVIGTDGDGNTYTRYAFVKDNAGNISAVKDSSYTLYKVCTNAIEDHLGDWGACSKSCGIGTQSRTVYNKDKYLGTSCASTSKSQNCNTQSCCSSTVVNEDSCTSWTWSSCTASCDGGTHYQYRT